MLFNSLAFLFGFLPIVYFVFWRLTTRKQRHVWLTRDRVRLLRVLELPVLPADGRLDARQLPGRPRVPPLVGPQRPRRWLLVVPIVIDLSLLGFFKYDNFFLDGIDQTLTAGSAIPSRCRDSTSSCRSASRSTRSTRSRTSSTPIAASITPTRNLFEFASYVSLFSQLVAGPIVRFRQIEKDLEHIDHADRRPTATSAGRSSSSGWPRRCSSPTRLR